MMLYDLEQALVASLSNRRGHVDEANAIGAPRSPRRRTHFVEINAFEHARRAPTMLRPPRPSLDTGSPSHVLQQPRLADR